MARNKTPGDARRVGAVKPRSQVKNETTGTWTKRDAKREVLRRAMERHITEGLSLPPSQVTRFEVIYEGTRAYVMHGVKVELSYQDEGRTLKVFVEPREQKSA